MSRKGRTGGMDVIILRACSLTGCTGSVTTSYKGCSVPEDAPATGNMDTIAIRARILRPKNALVA